MTLGQGAQALAEYLGANWEAERQGRPDLPDVVRDDAGDYSPDPSDHTSQPGRVLDRPRQLRRRGSEPRRHRRHLVLPPRGRPAGLRGLRPRRTEHQETVQIDISVTDGFNAPEGVATSARNRMVGERGSGTSVAFEVDTYVGEAYYPGLAGEVKYLLELTRRGLDEWDVSRTDMVNMVLNNSNADVSFRVTLEHVSKNTADAFV